MHRTVSILLCVLLIAGCAGPSVVPADGGGAARAQVTGTVSYRERLALLPGVVIKVQLADVSRADAPTVVIGEQVITTDGNQVPFGFAISYDPATINPKNPYAVSARMEDANGRLRFVTDQRYAVITRGAPTVGQHNREILRDVVGLSDAEIDAVAYCDTATAARRLLRALTPAAAAVSRAGGLPACAPRCSCRSHSRRRARSKSIGSRYRSATTIRPR